MLSHSPGRMNIGTIDVYLNKLGANLPTMAYHDEDRENEAWSVYLERKNMVLEFLHADLSLHLLRRHHKRIELLKKCSYYLEILPKHLALGDQNHLMLPTTMFQLIDPWRFQRMKKVGTIQTKIQLLLLSDLLEELERGREELVHLLETYDMMTFLSRWDTVKQKLSKLSEQMDYFLAMLVPGRLYIKHRLVSDVGITKIPHIRLVLSTKMPVMFDRRESAAHEDWVSLKWLITSQQSQLDQFELQFRLLEPRTPQERVQCGIMPVTSNTCEIHNLLSDRLYRFTIRRAETYTLVYEQWRDSILLKTKPYLAESVGETTSQP
ncbi:fibronectin type III domain-containing protein 11 [Notechis scutatus]|uniref:Fibronectin type III domain-containing protein 11 n=1 Tax=Notechis scutatus TaxID=8663 RepID=A0A6J1W0A1_9SAUR|nr:fibronectin type III domain-containing protein 11 [Notechis scutatus]